jgi:Protein of unknown function (DUF1593)
MRLTFALLLFLIVNITSQAQNKARTIITTDGELDDIDSFIRMLLYSNEFKIEGLVVSSSQWHYAGDGLGTKFTSEMENTKKLYGERTELRWPGTKWIYNLVDAYGQVYPNLTLHAKGYPKPDELKKLIRIGNIDFEGEMEKETDGAMLICDRLLDSNPEPIYLQAWGGTNTIAAALKSIEKEYINRPNWQDIYKKVSEKAIIYTILDQDATYRKYISQSWPAVRILYNENQFWSFAYFWKRNVPPALHKYMEGDFMSSKILLNKGPLLKMYHSYGDGNPPLGELDDIFSVLEKAKNNQWGSFAKYDFISEGDSPAFLHLVDIGLENLKNPAYGGWSGKLMPSAKVANRWEDGKAAAEFNPYTQKEDLSYAQTRWVADIQNDFAARASWCVNTYGEANHKPSIIDTRKKNEISVAAGKKVNLQVDVRDPDYDPVTISFWNYKEAGNAKVEPKITKKKYGTCEVKIPKDAQRGDVFHIIAEAKDAGEPNLKNYKRFIITVK